MRRIFVVALSIFLLEAGETRAGLMGTLPDHGNSIGASAIRYAVGSCGCVCGGGAGMAGGAVWMARDAGSAVAWGIGYEGQPEASVLTSPAVPQAHYLWSPGHGHSPVHYRYPYFSYRRPWVHPGPAVPNVTILW